MFSFAAQRQRRKPSLTPMIDVVFLLLVFFMLAARFGHDMAMSLTLASSGGSYEGPPRLLDVTPDATRLNGIATPYPAEALQPLMQSPDDMVLLRARDGASLQRLVDEIEALRGAGFTNLVLVE